MGHLFPHTPSPLSPPASTEINSSQIRQQLNYLNQGSHFDTSPPQAKKPFLQGFLIRFRSRVSRLSPANQLPRRDASAEINPPAELSGVYSQVLHKA